MIDPRHQTFLALCELKSYTETAKALHITQPAVSQHVKYLEIEYDCKLIEYSSKQLSITREGELLRDFLITLQADSMNLQKYMKQEEDQRIEISFGTTLSVGDYLLPKTISDIIQNYPMYKISMIVSNTSDLFTKLKEGSLDFILVEGYFVKDDFSHRKFSNENYIGVCASDSRFASGDFDWSDLSANTLILREDGSGTREILERILNENNYSFNSFDKIIEMGNFKTIKELVRRDVGISFVYDAVVKREFEQGILKKINIKDFTHSHDINFVCLKNTYYLESYSKFFDLLTETYKKQQIV